MIQIPKNAVLVPIDMQQGFDDPSLPTRWNSQCDANGLAVLAAWRASGRTVLHVRHDSLEEVSSLRPDHPGHAFRPGFEPQGDEGLVSKTVNLGFIGTDLDLRLRRLGTETVVAFGLTSDMCVSTTVRMGANLGYRMMVVEDACDCFTLPDAQGIMIAAQDSHRIHMATLRAEFAEVVTTAQLVAALKA